MKYLGLWSPGQKFVKPSGPPPTYLMYVPLRQHPENFAFLILIFIELFAREVCKFLKK